MDCRNKMNHQPERKSGTPTQPGHRSAASYRGRRKKRNNIVRRARRFYKRLNWKGRIFFAALIVAVLALIIPIIARGVGHTTAEPKAVNVEADKLPEYIFRDGEGHPVDLESMTDTWAAETGIEKRYSLTDAERLEIASVITAEAAGEPYAGKVAVAQCILQACEDDEIRPDEALVKYKYSTARPDPCEEALEAVEAVFDFGHVATAEPIKYYYAPARVYSEWHETQDFVMVINNHKFFAEDL